ncbi:hypothetical protein AYO44_09270 [Planctomycetaceae bacterium SCGC AG-212-F19]|nr:hypothetical protein AYO44_09270 [Planctomycetaceae bacterium SCGC AG-212-F19]
MFDIRRVDLAKLNSLTKYPSILTYHALGEKGVLQETVQVPFTGRVVGTEKVDGTNTRLIFCPDGAALVGSREDLLWERRDLIGNPAMGIVEAVKDTVQRLFETLCRPGRIAVYYIEVYGRNIGAAARNYTKEGKVGFRLFDVVVIDNFAEVLAWPAEQIARWRDGGGQKYAEADHLTHLAKDAGFEPVPPLFDVDASRLPTSLEAMYEFLLGFEATRCKLDDGAAGVPEGVVVRSSDRSAIAKLRREDYERTLRRRQAKK